MNGLSRKISNSELKIMDVIWEHGDETTFSQIWKSLDQNTKQATQSLIDRLVKKGILKQERRDVYYYSPLVSCQEYRTAKTRDLIDISYHGSAKSLVAALLNENAFSPEDIDELKEYWTSGGESG